MPPAVVEYARRVFTLDARSIALMRVGVAATVLVDLWVRSTHLVEHYSDAGVLPRQAAFVVSASARVSLLSLSGDPAWALAVFLAAGALASAVLVGFRSQLATLLLWVFVLSIQHRNPLVWDHRDVLISSALGWGLVLRWGSAWSLDGRRGRGARSGHSRAGASAALYVCQIACIYLFAALLKSGPEWRTELTAVERAVGVQYWATAFATHLLEHPQLMAVLTACVWWFELLVAPMLLCPWHTARLRVAVVVGLVLMQLGFGLFLWLDTFPMISLSISLGLLPTSLWSRAGSFEPPQSEPRWERALLLGLLGYLLVLNVLSLGRDPDRQAGLRWPAKLVGVDQDWTMFAPSPTRVDGWFVVAAQDRAGASMDLLTGRALDWSRPKSFRQGLRTTRELVYMRRLLAVDDARRVSFAEARCREGAPGRVAVDVHFVPVIDGVLGAPELLIAHVCR